MTTKPNHALLAETRRSAHPRCVVCGSDHAYGFGLQFEVQSDGSVETELDCDPTLQGYEGILHGGITSALLDGAMTNCLFARGVQAVTGEMTIRFRHPIRLDDSILVRSWARRIEPPLHEVEAEIVQQGHVKAKAVGRFVDRPNGKQVSF